MAATFTLSFKYTMNYVQNDVLYFGINLLLGCREFPLRFAGGSGGGGADITPKSTSTFNFSAKDKAITFTESNIFASDGKEAITREMLFSDPSNSNSWTFRMGSVALKQVLEVNHSGNINDFFDDQFIEIYDVDLSITIAGATVFTLTAKPDKFKLGKQYGETFLLSWP